MVKIILNADDFGRSLERNKAIDDSFRQGLICSAGLIVTGKYLQNAIDYINNGGYSKDVHLHLNLSTSLRDGNPEDIPLTEAMRRDSFFCNGGKFFDYKGLPKKLSDIKKWKIVFRELVAQYEKFIEVTNGDADYQHVDFHQWYNLTWPVSVALNLFIRKYKIKSVRFIGVHHMKSWRYRFLSRLSRPFRVNCIPAMNIDYYLTNRKSFTHYNIIELYCHPNYKEGVFLDDSPSYLKHERQPMLKQIQALKDTGEVEFISWNSLS